MQREISNTSENKIIIPTCKVARTHLIEAEGGYGYKGRQSSTTQHSVMSNYRRGRIFTIKKSWHSNHKYFTRACTIVFTHPLADPKIKIEIPKYHDNT